MLFYSFLSSKVAMIWTCFGPCHVSKKRRGISSTQLLLFFVTFYNMWEIIWVVFFLPYLEINNENKNNYNNDNDDNNHEINNTLYSLYVQPRNLKILLISKQSIIPTGRISNTLEQYLWYLKRSELVFQVMSHFCSVAAKKNYAKISHKRGVKPLSLTMKIHCLPKFVWWVNKLCACLLKSFEVVVCWWFNEARTLGQEARDSTDQSKKNT